MYIMESAPGPRTIINGREVDYFSGCGYFDFQGHPDIINAACETVKKYGISSGTSRAGFGYNPVLSDIETKASQFFGAEDVLYYVSGCLGTSILLEGLYDEYDAIFVDSESHYSILNAAYMVYKPVVKFLERDANDLKKKIKQFLDPSQRPVVICDGVFPISGEMSPIPDYIDVLEGIEDAVICVDDAHATGVIGEKGHGTFEYFGLEGEKLYFSSTLSKALGGHGGIIAGDNEFIKKLREKSTIANACSPPPNPAAAATAKALEILYKNPDLRGKLWDNVAYAKNGLRNLGFNISDTPVPIICLHSKENIDLEVLQKELFQKEIAATYLPPGTYTSVPHGGGLRISIFSSHTREQMDRLIYEIKSKI